MDGDPAKESTPGAVPLRELFRVFAMIGLSSFGGGLSGWIHREIVENRRWISEQDFLAGMAMSRTMPGANVVNLSIWIGYRLRGGPGAAAAAFAVLAGPLLLIVFVAALYSRWSHSAALHRALLGVVAAALAMTLSMCLKSFRAAATSPFYVLIIVLTFVGVGVLHWPMLPIAAVLIPASVGWSFFMESRREMGSR